MSNDLDSIQDDVLEFRRKTHGMFVSRRSFVATLAALGLSPLSATLTPVNAKEPDLVVANWGGDAAKSMDEAYTKAFVAANPGDAVRYDSSGPSSGKIKAMVEAKRVTWDMCDRIFYNSIELGEQGLLEDIDYGAVKKDMTLADMTGKWAVPFYSFGNVITYNTKAFGGRIPSTWADFWNLKDFPGRRTLRRHIEATLEGALLADGVAGRQALSHRRQAGLRQGARDQGPGHLLEQPHRQLPVAAGQGSDHGMPRPYAVVPAAQRHQGRDRLHVQPGDLLDVELDRAQGKSRQEARSGT